MTLYRLLCLRNNAEAILKGRYSQRVVQRTIWKHTSRLARFVSRALGVAR